MSHSNQLQMNASTCIGDTYALAQPLTSDVATKVMIFWLPTLIVATSFGFLWIWLLSRFLGDRTTLRKCLVGLVLVAYVVMSAFCLIGMIAPLMSANTQMWMIYQHCLTRVDAQAFSWTTVSTFFFVSIPGALWILLWIFLPVIVANQRKIAPFAHTPTLPIHAPLLT
jgi:hypothetical protein